MKQKLPRFTPDTLQKAINEIIDTSDSEEIANQRLGMLAIQANYQNAEQMMTAIRNPKQPPIPEKSIRRLETNLKSRGGDNAWLLHNLFKER